MPRTCDNVHQSEQQQVAPPPGTPYPEERRRKWEVSIVDEIQRQGRKGTRNGWYLRKREKGRNISESALLKETRSCLGAAKTQGIYRV
jgi:hypothetical protein